MPVRRRQSNGGNNVRVFTRVFAAVLALSVAASAAALAEPAKIDKSIYGFYLGESEESLIQRAKKEGIAHKRVEAMPKQLFPEILVFDGSLDRSKQVKSAVVSLYKGRVGQVSVYLVEHSRGEFLQAAQSLEQSWNSFSGFSDQSFGPMYIITLPNVLITLVDGEGETYISYVHRAMLGAYNEEKAGSRSR